TGGRAARCGRGPGLGDGHHHRHLSGVTVQVSEIFHSIQGESTYTGLPCTFIRLTGCNLRCVWCDTEYAFYGGEKMTVDQVLEKVHAFGGRLVEFTGCEPLLHTAVSP